MDPRSRDSLVVISPENAAYPAPVRRRLGDAAPNLTVRGNLDLLALPKTAVFCSARCPGNAILAAYDEATKLRDSGRCVIGGFHSPIEKDCLRILLRGTQPIIICPARAIETMRVPADCRAAFDAGRILFLSPFVDAPKRVTREAALRRNILVAALADDAYIAHVAPGGQTDETLTVLSNWLVPTRTNE